ncbi:MAG TPA: hypothetical protein VKD72_05905, partial [Gemmataceae bacterium]|nr:hypothetical protein [Gemmataceae bacterium]
QLFLVPGLIVAGLVVVWLLFNVRSSLDRKLQEILAELDSDNPEVRWRAAENLARALPSDERTRLHVGFALDLAVRLRGGLTRSEVAERDRLKRFLARKQSVAEETADLKSLEQDRKYLLFLTACQGYFVAPVGAPLLAEMALPQPGIEPSALHHRREFALFALSSLGESLNKFDALPQDRQEELLRDLHEEAERRNERGQLARQAHAYLSARRHGRNSNALNVTLALIRCAYDDDPYFRKLAAHAMSFWGDDGTQPVRARATVAALLSAPTGSGPLLAAASLFPGRMDGVERALLRLALDDGQGTDPDERDRERREIRYNAVIALARQGAPVVKRFLPVLEEMLDLEKQKTLCVAPEEQNAAVIVMGTLKAVARLHQKNRGLDLSALEPALDRLIDSGNRQLAEEAKDVRDQLAH